MNPRAIFLGVAAFAFACGTLLLAQEKSSGPWVMESSGTIAGLRGIHAVGGGVAWASGTDGTVLRTEDGGYMWQRCGMPPGAEHLDFRGIWAWDADTAVVMSSGPGDQSRIYKTTDGCSHWKLLFTNPDKDGFWDSLAFADRQHGHLIGDPVNGRFVFLTTTDGDAPPHPDFRLGVAQLARLPLATPPYWRGSESRYFSVLEAGTFMSSRHWATSAFPCDPALRSKCTSNGHGT